MAKAARAVCERCEHRVSEGRPYCGKCGRPTLWANHDDRVQWELANYRHKTQNVPLGVLYENTTAQTTLLEKPKRRKPRLFARRNHKSSIVLPQAKPMRVQPPVAAAPPAPVLRAVDPAPMREIAPKPTAVARPARSKMDKEPLRDTPATVLAMRMLNARVAELDSTIQKLQHEIEMLRRS